MKIIQITDSHLFSNDEQNMFGVKCNLKFYEVVHRILKEDIHNINMFFITGDISQDETYESYLKVVDVLGDLNVPIYWIPGNHDSIQHSELVFKKNKNFIQARNLIIPGWHLVFLNTKMNGTDEGYLAKSELEYLNEQILISDADKNIAIIMHHHPAKVGTPLIDNYILKNRDEFWDIISGTKVKLIICGHVHGDYSFKYNNVMIETSPASCLQWKKGTTNLNIINQIGYKIICFDKHTYTATSKLW